MDYDPRSALKGRRVCRHKVIPVDKTTKDMHTGIAMDSQRSSWQVRPGHQEDILQNTAAADFFQPSTAFKGLDIARSNAVSDMDRLLASHMITHGEAG